MRHGIWVAAAAVFVAVSCSDLARQDFSYAGPKQSTVPFDVIAQKYTPGVLTRSYCWERRGGTHEVVGRRHDYVIVRYVPPVRTELLTGIYPPTMHAYRGVHIPADVLVAGNPRALRVDATPCNAGDLIFMSQALYESETAAYEATKADISG